MEISIELVLGFVAGVLFAASIAGFFMGYKARPVATLALAVGIGSFREPIAQMWSANDPMLLALMVGAGLICAVAIAIEPVPY